MVEKDRDTSQHCTWGKASDPAELRAIYEAMQQREAAAKIQAAPSAPENNRPELCDDRAYMVPGM